MSQLSLTDRVRLALQRGHGPMVRRVWPLMLWLYCAQAAGHVVGFLFGPGDSPHRVQ